jgi:beta-lactamase class D
MAGIAATIAGAATTIVTTITGLIIIATIAITTTGAKRLTNWIFARPQGRANGVSIQKILSSRKPPMRHFLAAFCTGILLFYGSASAGGVCTVLAEADSETVLVRQGDCGRNSPASTFKIALSVMGYDAGVLQDAHTPVWPYLDSYQAWLDIWKKDADPTSWQRDSVVWYSQVLTRALGAGRFASYVNAFDYGDRNLSGDPGKDNGLTNAWLGSSLQISPEEQTVFLRKLLAYKLPASRAAHDATLAIVPVFPPANGWTVHGKTGTGRLRNADAKDPDRQFGWFVGWAEKGGHRIVFARLIKDDEAIQSFAGPRARDALLAELPVLLPHE